MKLDEIVDGEERRAKLDKVLAQMQRQFGTRKKEDPAIAAARNAQRVAHQATKDQYEQIVGRMAETFSKDQFDQFTDAVKSKYPDVEKFLDLQLIFNNHQPQLVQQNRDAWSDYGRTRQYKDPSVLNLGPSGERNRTGD